MSIGLATFAIIVCVLFVVGLVRKRNNGGSLSFEVIATVLFCSYGVATSVSFIGSIGAVSDLFLSNVEPLFSELTFQTYLFGMLLLLAFSLATFYEKVWK